MEALDPVAQVAAVVVIPIVIGWIITSFFKGMADD